MSNKLNNKPWLSMTINDGKNLMSQIYFEGLHLHNFEKRYYYELNGQVMSYDIGSELLDHTILRLKIGASIEFMDHQLKKLYGSHFLSSQPDADILHNLCVEFDMTLNNLQKDHWNSIRSDVELTEDDMVSFSTLNNTIHLVKP